MKKNQFTPADHKEIILGPSEHGGSSTIIFYFSSDYKPSDKEHATRAIAHEYDDKGRSMHREYLVLRAGVVIPSQDLSDQDFSDGFEDKIVVTRRKAWNSNKSSNSQKQRTNSNNQRNRSNHQRKNSPSQQGSPQSKDSNNAAKKRNTRPNPNKQQPSKNKTASAPVANGARASDIPNRPKRSRPRNNNNSTKRPTSTKAP